MSPTNEELLNHLKLKVALTEHVEPEWLAFCNRLIGSLDERHRIDRETTVWLKDGIMFKVTAEDKPWERLFGWVYPVKSPISGSRDGAAMKAAIGPRVEIDGTEYEVVAIEHFLPLTDVAIGEAIGILVKPLSE